MSQVKKKIREACRRPPKTAPLEHICTSLQSDFERWSRDQSDPVQTSLKAVANMLYSTLNFHQRSVDLARQHPEGTSKWIYNIDPRCIQHPRTLSSFSYLRGRLSQRSLWPPLHPLPPEPTRSPASVPLEERKGLSASKEATLSSTFLVKVHHLTTLQFV